MRRKLTQAEIADEKELYGIDVDVDEAFKHLATLQAGQYFGTLNSKLCAPPTYMCSADLRCQQANLRKRGPSALQVL